MLKKTYLLILLGLFAAFSLPIYSQESEPTVDQNHRYNVQFDIRQAYISGICIMHAEGEQVTTSIMNEFGVSAMTYRYDINKGKVKILSIMKPLNKWYIKRILKKDLKNIMQQIVAKPESPLLHENKKYNIRYNFSPLTNETAE